LKLATKKRGRCALIRLEWADQHRTELLENLAPGTLGSILKQAGLKGEDQ